MSLFQIALRNVCRSAGMKKTIKQWLISFFKKKYKTPIFIPILKQKVQIH